MEALLYIALVVIIIGSVCSIIWPKKMWYLAEGWKYKNVKPSDSALKMTRVGGVVGIIVGIIVAIVFTVIFSNMRSLMPAGFP